MARFSAAVLAMLCQLASMGAAESSEQLAAIEYSTCVAACQTGQSENRCAKYCQCTTERSRTEFTRKESRQFGTAMLYGGRIDPAVADKLRNIILHCASKTFR